MDWYNSNHRYVELLEKFAFDDSIIELLDEALLEINRQYEVIYEQVGRYPEKRNEIEWLRLQLSKKRYAETIKRRNMKTEVIDNVVK